MQYKFEFLIRSIIMIKMIFADVNSKNLFTFQVFFVLRKKTNHVSFLHVYHHSGMVLASWVGVKYIAGGHGLYIGAVNCIVHSFMYFYYLLSIWDERIKKSIWWKKHITQLQLVNNIYHTHLPFLIVLFFYFIVAIFTIMRVSWTNIILQKLHIPEMGSYWICTAKFLYFVFIWGFLL